MAPQSMRSPCFRSRYRCSPLLKSLACGLQDGDLDRRVDALRASVLSRLDQVPAYPWLLDCASGMDALWLQGAGELLRGGGGKGGSSSVACCFYLCFSTPLP